MATICYYSVPLHGHINPVLSVLAELVKRGERVIAYNSEAYRAPFERVGAEFRPYPDSKAVEAALPNTTDINFFMTTLRLLRLYPTMLPFAREETAREKPAVITHDMLAGWAKVSAAETNTAALMFVPAIFETTQGALKILPKSLMARSMLQYARLFFPIMQTQRAVETQLNLPRGTLNSPLITAEKKNIAFTARELQPFPETVKQDVEYVGMEVAPRSDTLDFPLDESRPVVYIALGTITTESQPIYKACFEAFGDYPAQFVMSVGRGTELSSLGTIPSNFIVRNFVAQLEILKRAAVFISHSGGNSAYESLHAGVPLIIVPTAPDPLLVAYRIVESGAAVMIPPSNPLGKAKASDLRAALERIMNNHAAFQRQAVALGEALRAAGGASRAADVIQALK